MGGWGRVEPRRFQASLFSCLKGKEFGEEWMNSAGIGALIHLLHDNMYHAG